MATQARYLLIYSHMVTSSYLFLGGVHIGAVLVEAALVCPHPDILPHAGPGVSAHDGAHDAQGQEPRRRLEAVLVDLCAVEGPEEPVQTVLALARVLLPVGNPLRLVSSHCLVIQCKLERNTNTSDECLFQTNQEGGKIFNWRPTLKKFTLQQLSR